MSHVSSIDRRLSLKVLWSCKRHRTSKHGSGAQGKPTTAVSMDAFSASAPASPDGTVTVNAPADAPEESTWPPVALAPGAADSFAAEGSMAAPMMAPAAAPEESTRPPVALAPGAADSFAAEAEAAPGMAPDMSPANAPEESTRPPVALAPGAADAFAAEADTTPEVAAATEAEPET